VLNLLAGKKLPWKSLLILSILLSGHKKVAPLLYWDKSNVRIPVTDQPEFINSGSFFSNNSLRASVGL